MSVGHDDALAHAGRLGVPEIDEREQRRQIARQRRIAEVRIHRRGAVAKLGEALPSAADRNRQPGRGPERETAADPIPHRQHVAAGDAESARGRDVRRNGDEVRPQRGTAAELRRQPLARGSRVPERFLRSERLGHHHEQRRRRIGARQRARKVLGIEVRDKRDIDTVAAYCSRAGEHVADEPGPEIRAADTDADHITDRPAGSAEPRAAAQLDGERAHASLRAADRGNHVGTIDGERSIALRPQSGVEDRPGATYAGRGAVSDEQRHGLGGEPLLRPVGKPIVPGER